MTIASLKANEVALAGTNLIEASAGTGKTYAIATLYVRSLLETEARVENILVVTYTRAATAELRDRIRRRITETREALRTESSEDESLQAFIDSRIAAGTVALDRKRLSLALRSFDQAAIFTIHGFCQRCLQESAFESGTAFESEFEADDRILASEIADDFWANEMFNVDPALFAYYQSQKLSPKTLRKLAQEIIGNPDLQVLPETLTNTAGASDIEDFASCYANAQKCWSEHRDHIVDLLSSHSSLNQRSYKASQVAEKYAPAIDELFASPSATLVDGKHPVFRLTTKALAPGKGTNKGGTAPVHEFFDQAAALETANQEAAAYFEAQLLALQLRLVPYIRQENASRKAKQLTLSFDDLLLQLRAALRNGAAGDAFADAIFERYPLALIDEFQDTDPVQYEIFGRIYNRGGDATTGRSLFLIGDPKQAIYGFRNADVATYCRALHILQGSWRCRRPKAHPWHQLPLKSKHGPSRKRDLRAAEGQLSL